MLRYVYALFSMLLLVGCQCNKQNEKYTRFYEDGRSKPIVTVVPMIDSTSYDIPWSISEEFTDLVKNRLTRQGDMFVSKETPPALSSQDNPFDTNFSWVKTTFKPGEFIVFLELVEHEDVPLITTVKDPIKIPESRKAAANLNMTMRIRIIDIRGDTPKLVLQEKITDVFYISNTLDKPNYNITSWGTEEYKTSPMGIAHFQFTKQLTDHISDYIMLSKSR